MDILKLLSTCIDKSASDLHISSCTPAAIRVNGDMLFLDSAIMSNQEIHKLMLHLCTDKQIEQFNKTMEVDFAINIPEVNYRFRVNFFMQQRGISAAFRTIPNHIKSLDDLKLPQILKKICQYESGLIIVTGATGSGKSTTLAAMINYINNTKQGHIISIEDPIEFIHKPNKCLINQREVENTTLSFSNALRSSFREDPDYILIGEMRDIETIRLAITAAETGHLVFATLHTQSAPKTVDRIINVFPSQEQPMIRSILSESLKAIVSQKLIKSKDTGRIAAHEILIANNAIQNLIRENKTAQIYNTLQTNQALGMQTMQQSINNLISDGLIYPPTDAKNLL